jgi:hypothetical protein
VRSFQLFRVNPQRLARAGLQIELNGFVGLLLENGCTVADCARGTDIAIRDEMRLVQRHLLFDQQKF